MSDHMEFPPPSKDQSALEMYRFLRHFNPHLPDPSFVLANDPVKLSFGPKEVSAMTITIAVNLPEFASSEETRSDRPEAQPDIPDLNRTTPAPDGGVGAVA